MSTCANCGDVLAGDYCSRCGQRAADLHRPIPALLSDAVGDVFNLDTRLLRTLRPLLLTPGAVAKHYLAGRGEPAAASRSAFRPGSPITTSGIKRRWPAR